MARASSALAAGEPAAAAELASLDTAPLGLSGLAPYSRLLARVILKKELSPAAALVAFAEGEAFEPLAREALGEAARRAHRRREEARASGLGRARAPGRGRATRATIARALALSRVAESENAAREHRWALAARFPDAPERAADDFDDIDLKGFAAAVKGANETIRIGRARALAVRAPDEAKVLLFRVGPRPENRLALAETRYLLGEMKDVLGLLQGPGVRGDAATAAHVAALETSASLHLVERTRAARTGGSRADARRKVAGSPPLSGKERKEALERLSSLDAVLALPLSDSDRRRLLGDGLRVWLRLDRHPDARRLLEALLKLEPMSSTGGEEFFQEAFAAYAAGRFMDAARLWDEQLSVYRDVWVRRRATYWAGRARERAGDLEGARALWASLVPGTSADVYARWASAALGVPLTTAHGMPSAAAGDVESLSGDHPAAPSRELLACGFPDLAEDAAENEGSLDPLFGAALASEWGDHRRAVSLLKQRYPEVGTPEEGAVPLAARRAYYPLARAALVTRAAAEAGLPAALVFGVIRQESVFQTSVKSHAGALGLMQVMPATGRGLRRGENRKGRPDLLDPTENVRLGVLYLAQLLRQFGGDTGRGARGVQRRSFAREALAERARESSGGRVSRVPPARGAAHLRQARSLLPGRVCRALGAGPGATSAVFRRGRDRSPQPPALSAAKAAELRSRGSPAVQGFSGPAPAGAAQTPDLVGVRRGHEVVGAAYRVLPALDRRVDELDHLSAARADEVVVVLALPKPLVPVFFLVQADPPHEAAFVEQLQRPVDGGPADLGAALAHPDHEVLGVEVAVRREDLVEERAPLAGRFEPFPFQELAEETPLFEGTAHAGHSSAMRPLGRFRRRPRSC